MKDKENEESIKSIPSVFACIHIAALHFIERLIAVHINSNSASSYSISSAQPPPFPPSSLYYPPSCIPLAIRTYAHITRYKLNNLRRQI